MTITSATIQISVADGTTMRAYLARQAADYAPAGVIVAHELFAVNPDIRGVADDLAEAGYATIAPESTTGTLRRAAGSNATMPAARRPSSSCTGSGAEQALDDVTACISWLESQPAIERTAMVGFSAAAT